MSFSSFSDDPSKGKPFIENEDEFKLLLYSQALSPAFGGTIAFVKETEPLLERGQGKSSSQMKVCRLFSICSADIYLILCTHLYFVYCTSRKSFGSDDDFCCGCQNVSEFWHRQLLPGHSYTKGHTTQRVVCLRPVTDFLFPFRTHSTTCAWFHIGLEKVNWKHKSRDNEIVLQLQEWYNNSAGITFTKSSHLQSELSLRYLNNL